MENEKLNISRRDFYSAMMVVWTFISIIFIKQLRAAEDWTDYVPFLGSAGTMLYYVCKIYSEQWQAAAKLDERVDPLSK